MKTDTIQITLELLSMLSEIDEFKGAWRALGTLAPDRLNALRRIATVESVGSSTRIEGSKLTDREVAHLLAKLEIKSFASRDEQEVAGYAQVMEAVFEAWPHILLTENHLKQLHRDLLNHSAKDERHRGEYKKIRNDVGAFDAAGTMIGVVFETALPFDTPHRMAELLAWLKDARDLGRLHPLIIVAVFIVTFLEIHAFQDGNGRLSRILTTLLLLQAGYAYVPYSSLESVMEQNKEGYYLALHDPRRRAELAALAAVLYAFAAEARTALGRQDGQGKEGAHGAARTGPQDPRLRARSRSRHDARHRARNGCQSKYLESDIR